MGHLEIMRIVEEARTHPVIDREAELRASGPSPDSFWDEHTPTVLQHHARRIRGMRTARRIPSGPMGQAERRLAAAIREGEGEYRVIPDLRRDGTQNYDGICHACPDFRRGQPFCQATLEQADMAGLPPEEYVQTFIKRKLHPYTQES